MIFGHLVKEGRLEQVSRAPGLSIEGLLGNQNCNLDELKKKIKLLQGKVEENSDPDPLRYLQNKFSLTNSEVFILSLALFAELDSQAERLFSFLGLTESMSVPSLWMALQLLDFKTGSEWPFSPDSSLMQFHLIDVFERPPVGKIVDRLFRLNDRIFRFLVGDNSPGEILGPYISLHEGLRSHIPQAEESLVGAGPFILCEGESQERHALALRLAGKNQLEAIFASAEEMESIGQSPSFIGELFKEAVLTNALLVLCFEDGLQIGPVAKRVFSEARRFQWPVVALMPRCDEKFEGAQIVRLKSVGNIPERKYAKKDLIFAKEVEQQFNSMLSGIRNREFVLKEWGFAKDFSTRKGVNVLFYGASGTGKTLSANVMAHELGRTLLRIDLSSLVSKYVGETEKNIEKIFKDQVDRNTVVFFDEAEALFASRTEQKTSNDRFSNLEINFLLQKMENHEGVIVLATNLEKNIDSAFFRRFDHSIRFTLPEFNERRILWQNSFPVESPVGNISFDLLAEKMKISGASIRKIALNAALSAKLHEERIEMDHIFGAAEVEHKKMGLFFSNPREEEALL
jgi:hypothetical protein